MIEDIRVEKFEGVYIITTEKRVIQASRDQFFYELLSNYFVKAEQLKARDLLLTESIEGFPCISVECEDISTKVYDLTLHEPHLFFSSQAQILTHNNSGIIILTYPPFTLNGLYNKVTDYYKLIASAITVFWS